MASEERGHRGERVTVYTVADRARVSVATVSRVMQQPHRVKETTRDKVLTAIDDLGYVPHGAARSLASQQHEAHGLVLPELGGPYYSELLTGYESVAADVGHSVVLLLTHDKSDLDMPLRRLASKVDGIALMGTVDVPTRTMDALLATVPVLRMSRHRLADAEAFSTENRTSAETLTRHLFAHGRRHLLFVGSPELATDVQERYEGFVAAHAERPATQPLPAEPRESEGRRIADLILSGRIDADALVCANDELALAAMDRLTSSGVDVPRDLAVVGWDDVPAARYVRPRLTTVSQPIRELGARVATRMHELISGDGEGSTPTPHILPTRVVIRQSCGWHAHDVPAREFA